MAETILAVNNLAVSFHMTDRLGNVLHSQGIKNISLEIERGEILAVVGASGSGKSLLAHAVLGILPYNADVSGTMFYKGELLSSERQEGLRGREMALIPQSVTYLDPLMRVGKQVVGLHGKQEDQRKIFNLLKLDERVERLYPFQLSGGMARRVLVSTALISEANLIIADEPTPGMELRDAVEALKQLRLMADDGKAVMLITHDIDLAVEVADRIAVIYDGGLIDTVEAEVFKGDGSDIEHPYTRALFDSLPQNGFQLTSIKEMECYAAGKNWMDSIEEQGGNP
ncbi:MAG: ABC transporter ATP-binding protein [Succiniclasticum sp.]|nr:ABC transporter ATP-binding protein [Succiniclasticum sp.]MDY6087606.1 ABC transporter ATP-binding protein [Succiniclasticum sp.]